MTLLSVELLSCLVSPCSHMLVPPKWEHTPHRSSATHRRSASTALAGTHRAIGADPRAGRGPFPKPRSVVLPMVNFGQAKPAGHGHIHNADGGLIHHQYRLSMLQWNPGPARSNTSNIIAATCGRFHAVILQEASDHVPHITDQFIADTGNTDLAILLNKNTFEPNPAVLAFNEASTSKDTWSMVILIVRGLLRRLSLSGTPTVTFCSVHTHHVVTEKRAAISEPPKLLASGAKLWAYLDDWYIWIKPQHIPAAFDLASCAPSTSNWSPPRCGSGQPRAQNPSHPPSWIKPIPRWNAWAHISVTLEEPGGTGRAALREHRHAPLPEHFGQSARTQPSGFSRCRQ